MRCLAEGSCVASEQGLQCITEILQDVPPIGNLNSLRGSTGCSSPIGIPTVAADDFDTRMRLQPSCNGGFGALGQQINWFVFFQIDQDSAKPTAASKRPVVDAQHARRWMWGKRCSANEAQECSRTRGQSKTMTETCSQFPTRSKANQAQQLGQAHSFLGIWLSN